MNEKYLKDLYGWIVQNDSTYGKDIPYATFIQKMQDSSYAKEMHGWVGSIDPSFTKDIPIDSFLSNIKTSPVEKKNSVVSGSSLADASSASLSQETEDDGILSKIRNAALKAEAATLMGAKNVTDAVGGIASNIWSEGFLKPADDVLNAFKNQLRETDFFGGDIPDTDKPASDAVKKQLEQLSKKKGEDMSPLDPRAILKGIGNVSSLIINSVLPQKEKNKLVLGLANASSSIKDQIKDIEDYQQKVAPEGAMKIPYEITKNIAGMAPDLVLAAAMENPAYAESAAAKWAETTTKKAVPLIEKYSPKAAKTVEKYLPKTTKLVTESATSPFTKIMAVKGAVKGMAETEEGEDPYVNSLYGALEGAAEGAYMHVLGVTAGQVSPAIAKLISKTGLNSAIATAISNPLANAGVFTSAKALRVAATERRALTPEEMIMEAGTGVGFSLLHAGSIYKNQNEANHYYETVLSDNPINSLGRVINETKANLDISYDPNLTQDDIQAMMTARDAIKKAILKEPDMQKKKTLGDEAVKLQNKIDAHNTVNDIVEHRDALIDLMNNNKSFGATEKKMIVDKISAIADAYDNSEFGTRKRELNTEIMNLDAELSDLSEKFTDSKLPSERAALKAFIDAKKIKLAELNNELTELMTNKQKEDAIQKQTTDESVLLGQQPELGLQKMGEGDTKLKITPEQEKLISDEKTYYQEILDNPEEYDEQDLQEANDYFADPVAFQENRVKFWEDLVKEDPTEQSTLDFVKARLEAHKAAEVKPEVVDAFKNVESTENALIEYTRQPDFAGAPSKKGYQNSEKQNKFFAISDLVPKEIWARGGYTPQKAISDAYHEAKADGSNPELVKAVEDLLGKKPESTTIQAGSSATVSEGKPTEVTTGGKGTETATGGTKYESENTKIEDDGKGNFTVTLDGKEIGKMYYNKEFGFFNNSNFDKANAKPYTVESLYGDVLGSTREQAVNELLKRSRESKRGDVTMAEGRETKTGGVEYDKMKDTFFGGMKPNKNRLFFTDATKDFQYRGDNRADIVLMLDGANFWLTEGADGYVTIEDFQVSKDKLGTGKGKVALSKLIEYADKNGITLIGEPLAQVERGRGEKGLSQKQLIEFYKKNGFDKISKDALSKNKTAEDNYLERKPQSIELQQAPETKTSITTATTGGEGTETKTSGWMDESNTERELRLEEERKLSDLTDEVNRAKRKIASADDTDAAIEDLNKAKKERDDFEEAITKRQKKISDNIKLNNLLEDERIRREEDGDSYEYSDLYDKDPRLASLKRAEHMLDFINSDDWLETRRKRESDEEVKESREDSNRYYTEDIETIKNDLKENPPKEKAKKQKTTKPKPESTTVTVGAGGATATTSGKPTDVTMAEGRETKTGVMDDIELLIPKYKEYVDRDLQKAKDKYRINKSEANKKALDKAKAEAEAYKKDVADSKEEALKILTESNEYKTASQVQQDAMVKEVVRKFGERIKKSPSPETILGVEPPKVVTMTEKTALKEQIKAFGRGVKEGLKTAKDLMERRKVFAEAIKQIEKSGAISTKKVDALLNKISKVNLEDDAAVEKVIEYAEKLFEDAEYDNKLNDANGVRAAIKALASNKKKNADLSVFAKQFLKIRPSDVENIDEYNEMAKKIRESLEGSKITKDKNNSIKIADMIDIAKMGEYVDKTLDAQYKIDKDKLIKSARGIMGDDATFLSDDEVLELVKTGQVEKNEKVDDSLLKKITERVNKIFDSSAAMVDEILRTGKDPLTGEDIDLSEGRKKIVERFMSMDMKDLSDKEKLGVIDALNNFIRNGSVANMETVYADYKAKDSLAKAIENNVVAKKLKLFFSKKTGRAFGQQISTLPNLTEQMFRGVAASEEFKRLSGITELVNKKAAVQRTMNVLTDSFIKEFYKQKANGKAFDTAENVAERGIIAAMKRDIIGTPEQQKAEFKRKKELAEKSIELLKDGNEQERKLADVYQKAYDKVLKDSNTVDEVLKKSDDKNIEAVDWWIDKWSDIYDQLADVTEGIYNEKLDRDLNYTNFKFSLLSGGQRAPEISSRESVFLNSNNDIFGKGVYKKKAGVLEKTTRPDADGMEDIYLDLSFDRNMINAYQDALMDINTAGTVRQIESFFSSKAIKKIIPNKEDRDLLFRNNGKEGVIPDLIRTARQRQVVQTDELTSVLRKLSNLGTAGAATALAGVTQPIKQTVPVTINTLINTGRMPDFRYFMNKDKVDFINNSQRGIAIRGGKSRVSVDSINKLAEAADTSKASKIIDFLGKTNEMALKALVEKPDVWIAKASWITYYEKSLKKQGIDPSKFDYGKDKINEEAADYAQDMVDRQQNISDADLQGKLMNTKDPLKSVMVKTVMPFASFRMNQTMRMYSDLKTAFSKKGEATKEDRATARRSLAGYAAEMATFKYLQYLIASTLANAAVQAMGINETDDDKKKREEILKRSQTTGTVTDVLSPLPMLDVPVAVGTDKVMSYFQDLENIDDEDKFHLMTSIKQNGARSLGLYGIAIDKADQIIEAFEISTTGKYTDEYGREKYVSTKTADALGDVALLSTGSSLIGFPSEMNAVLRNSLRLAKKNSSTKEGGKEAYLRQKEQRRVEVLRKKETKMKEDVKALNEMLDEETDNDKIKEIKAKIREAKEAPYKSKEQKEEEKLTRKEEKEKLEEQLQGYDNKSDMKRYDPDLYDKTFGDEEDNVEKEVKSDLTKEKRRIEDEENDYSKRKKRKKNRDGTYKKSYYKVSFKKY